MSEQPYYARRNDQGYYTWEGIKLPSVTTVLSSAPGQHLMSWYGKQAALRALAHLWQAGVKPETPPDEVALEFVSQLTPRAISKAQAIAEVYDWQKVMREAERYRDHKARIGSVAHHALYQHALGTRRKNLEDYTRELVIELDLWREQGIVPTESMVCALASSALPYVMSALEWVERFQPEWIVIGQEAVIIAMPCERHPGYAGTQDGIALFRKSVWEQWAEWPFGDRPQVLATGDFKTSNSLPTTVQAQVSAYRKADFIGLVATGERIEMPETDALFALHIGPHESLASTTDEFGTLESKAKVMGAKIYTWDATDDAWEAFLGLLRWFTYTQSRPKAHQQQRAPKAPRPEPGKAPF